MKKIYKIVLRDTTRWCKLYQKGKKVPATGNVSKKKTWERTVKTFFQQYLHLTDSGPGPIGVKTDVILNLPGTFNARAFLPGALLFCRDNGQKDIGERIMVPLN